MGTSTRLPGPKNGSWTAAKGRLGNWTPDATSRRDQLLGHDHQRAEVIAAQYQRALRDALNADPEAFGIRAAAEQAGGRLIELLDGLGRADLPLVGTWPRRMTPTSSSGGSSGRSPAMANSSWTLPSAGPPDASRNTW
ncbi:hypothetical protein NKG94_45655 [Micromonospora sp. M12]